MFTGLPAMPASLARWFLVDETEGGWLDFPVDIIKIGETARQSEESNKRFVRTFDP